MVTSHVLDESGNPVARQAFTGATTNKSTNSSATENGVVSHDSGPVLSQFYWLRRGVCPECRGGMLTPNDRCDSCNIDWHSQRQTLFATTPPFSGQDWDELAHRQRIREQNRSTAPGELFTREELFQLHNSLCDNARDLMKLKNHDYSGATPDPFGNFRASSVVGIHPVTGILLRCLDKFARLKSFINSGNLMVKDEPVDDVFRDVINYMVLASGMVEEERRRQKIADCTVSLASVP